MKCEVIIDPNCEEQVLIYAKEETELVKSIKALTEEWSEGFWGYSGKEMVKLCFADVYCFSIMDNKVYAVCEKEKFQIKERLYVIEEKLPDSFIKINQSCIVNLNKAERFDASISGTLKILLKNGYTDYVSRRQLKFIKERIGSKNE